MQWTVLFPVRALPGAKSRLQPDLLGAAAHAELVTAMSADTLAAIRTAKPICQMVVVADTAAALRHVPAELTRLVQRRPGLNAALAEADALAHRQFPGHARAAVVGDLPGLTGEALTDLLAQAAGHHRAFVADHTGQGTTVLTVTSGPLAPQFGEGSAARHRRGAVALGAPWGARHDVDLLGDLRPHHRPAGMSFGPATTAALDRLGNEWRAVTDGRTAECTPCPPSPATTRPR